MSTPSGDSHTIVLSGDVDAARDSELAGLAQQFAASSAASVAVDLRDVTFLDSGGLRFIIRLRNIAVERGGVVELIGPQPPVSRVLTIVNFDELCTIVAAGPTEADSGPADPGPADSGPTDPGPADSRPADAGLADSRPSDSGP
jgi:anti-anti-sigma factor